MPILRVASPSNDDGFFEDHKDEIDKVLKDQEKKFRKADEIVGGEPEDHKKQTKELKSSLQDLQKSLEGLWDKIEKKVPETKKEIVGYYEETEQIDPEDWDFDNNGDDQETLYRWLDNDMEKEEGENDITYYIARAVATGEKDKETFKKHILEGSFFDDDPGGKSSYRRSAEETLEQLKGNNPPKSIEKPLEKVQKLVKYYGVERDHLTDTPALFDQWQKDYDDAKANLEKTKKAIKNKDVSLLPKELKKTYQKYQKTQQTKKEEEAKAEAEKNKKEEGGGLSKGDRDKLMEKKVKNPETGNEVKVKTLDSKKDKTPAQKSLLKKFWDWASGKKASDDVLRGSLIRLAYQVPDIRDQILPVVLDFDRRKVGRASPSQKGGKEYQKFWEPFWNKEVDNPNYDPKKPNSKKKIKIKSLDKKDKREKRVFDEEHEKFRLQKMDKDLYRDTWKPLLPLVWAANEGAIKPLFSSLNWSERKIRYLIEDISEVIEKWQKKKKASLRFATSAETKKVIDDLKRHLKSKYSEEDFKDIEKVLDKMGPKLEKEYDKAMKKASVDRVVNAYMTRKASTKDVQKAIQQLKSYLKPRLEKDEFAEFEKKFEKAMGGGKKASRNFYAMTKRVAHQYGG
jgi:hypothetical protein